MPRSFVQQKKGAAPRGLDDQGAACVCRVGGRDERAPAVVCGDRPAGARASRKRDVVVGRGRTGLRFGGAVGGGGRTIAGRRWLGADELNRAGRNVEAGPRLPAAAIQPRAGLLDLAHDQHLLETPDLQMLVMDGGRERTEAEFRALMSASGLKLVRTIPLTASLAVLEVACA